MPAIHDVVVVATLDCACCGKPGAQGISEQDGVLVCNDDCMDRLKEVDTFGKDMQASTWKHGNKVIATVVKPVAFTLHRRTKEEKAFRNQRRTTAEKRRAEEEERKYQQALSKTEQEKRKAEAERRKSEAERSKMENLQFNVQSVLQQLEINMPVLDYKELKQVSKTEELTDFQRCIVGTAVDYLRQFE